MTTCGMAGLSSSQYTGFCPSAAAGFDGGSRARPSSLSVSPAVHIVANYIGRGRHHANTARIRELEAEIRGMRGS